MNRIGITMGDPAGIGPEVVSKALLAMTTEERAGVVVFGDPVFMARAAELVGADFGFVEEGSALTAGAVAIHPIEAPNRDAIRPGELSVEAGEIGYLCVAKAVEEALAGRIDVISTASLNKTALRMAGRGSNGHAGILSDLTGVKKAYAVLACPQFSVIHVSTHVSLARASELCRTPLVLDTIRAADHHMRTAGFDRPRVVVAGLNPHCGESRLYGTEDDDEVIPAIHAARAEGIEVAGPVPGDVVFQQAIDGKYDIVVAQFHDQGHIPAKLIGHHDCVNVTAGLPVLRTSVDHGTAFDIAWKGIADPSNMKAALAMARRMKPIDR